VIHFLDSNLKHFSSAFNVKLFWVIAFFKYQFFCWHPHLTALKHFQFQSIDVCFSTIFGRVMKTKEPLNGDHNSGETELECPLLPPPLVAVNDIRHCWKWITETKTETKAAGNAAQKTSQASIGFPAQLLLHFCHLAFATFVIMRKWKQYDPVSHHRRRQLSTPATALGHGPTMWTHMWRVGESRVRFRRSAGSLASQIVKCNKTRVLYGSAFCSSASHGNYPWHMDKWIFLLSPELCKTK